MQCCVFYYTVMNIVVWAKTVLKRIRMRANSVPSILKIVCVGGAGGRCVCVCVCACACACACM